jgi:hypothetical protein
MAFPQMALDGTFGMNCESNRVDSQVGKGLYFLLWGEPGRLWVGFFLFAGPWSSALRTGTCRNSKMLSGVAGEGDVEEGHFVGGWSLEGGCPALEVCALDGWVLHAASLEALEESIDGSGEDVELDSGSGGAGCEAELVALGAAPGSPFDDDGEAEVQKALGELALEGFDICALGFVVEVEFEGGHPVVGGKADGIEPGFEGGGVSRFARAGEAADENEAGAGTVVWSHSGIMADCSGWRYRATGGG